MNVFNKLAVCILVVIGVTACNKEESPANNDDRVAVQFTAQIGVQSGEISAKTRASGTSWAADDQIGVYMVHNGGTIVAMESENRKYTTETGDGVFSAEEEDIIYFPVNGNDTFDFIAYYPYQTGITDFIYKVDVSEQNNPGLIDLMYVNSYGLNTSGYTKYDPAVNLIFEHQLSKFVLETRPGSGLEQSDLDDMKVTITGMNTKMEFDLSTGIAVSGSETTQASVIPYTTTTGRKYQAILLPASNTAEEWRVNFIIGEDVYVWKMPVTAMLESGKEHTWEISVQKTPVELSNNIKDWTSGDGGNGVAW